MTGWRGRAGARGTCRADDDGALGRQCSGSSRGNRSRSYRRALCALGLALALAGGGGAPLHAALPDPVRFGVAMEVGDIGAAQRWLDAGLDPDFEAESLGSGLMIGAWEGNIALMALFAERGADVNFTSRIGEQALTLAAWRGHIDAVRWLLARGARVNRDARQWSALHYATFAGRTEIVELLLAHGADIDARTSNDSTALMLTAREGHERLARLLLERGADPRPTNDWGDSALSWAMARRNLRIGRLVAAAIDSLPPEASSPSFAAAVDALPPPEAVPPRSLPAPPAIDDLLQQLRIARVQGKPTEDIRRALYAAVERFRAETPTTGSAAAQALVVTAKRGGAGGERAELVSTPDGGDGEVARLLQQIRDARAQGRPVEDLRRALDAAIARFKGEAPAR